MRSLLDARRVSQGSTSGRKTDVYCSSETCQGNIDVVSPRTYNLGYVCMCGDASCV